MNKQITVEGNTLVANFMTGNKTVRSAGGARLFEINGGRWKKEDLRYNESWDWLMPAVSKIENIMAGNLYCYEVNISGETCEIVRNTQYGITKEDEFPQMWARYETKIKATYETIIQFIKWHNLNP